MILSYGTMFDRVPSEYSYRIRYKARGHLLFPPPGETRSQFTFFPRLSPDTLLFTIYALRLNRRQLDKISTWILFELYRLQF